MSETIISAVICTHNRAGYLRKSLESLLHQTLPKERYEIIVVDNGSTDSTRESFEEVTRNREGVRDLGCQYLFEPVLGLSQSRNAGWQAARGKYVAYLDDDAVARPDWLEKILAAFGSARPEPGCVGGKVLPIWEGERPAWLADRFLGQFTVLDWGGEPFFIGRDKWLVGANMAFPRALLIETGGFETSLGRTGSSLVSMEEVFLRERIEEEGYPYYYDPGVIVEHHILASRVTPAWLRKRAFWQGVSSGIIRMLRSKPPRLKRIKIACSTLARILASPKDIASMFARPENTQSFALQCSVFARLGHVALLLGLIRRPRAH